MDLERAMEFSLEQQARFDARMDQLMRYQIDGAERHEREMAAIRADLRRGVQMAVEEARRERQRRQAVHVELSAAQKATEEKLAELSAAQRVTEAKAAELYAAQKITEERLAELSAAQKVTEARVAELHAAQKITEEKFQRLIDRDLNR